MFVWCCCIVPLFFFFFPLFFFFFPIYIFFFCSTTHSYWFLLFFCIFIFLLLFLAHFHFNIFFTPFKWAECQIKNMYRYTYEISIIITKKHTLLNNQKKKENPKNVCSYIGGWAVWVPTDCVLCTAIDHQSADLLRTINTASHNVSVHFVTVIVVGCYTYILFSETLSAVCLLQQPTAGLLCYWAINNTDRSP